jgi:4-amino-4-deoxy-L-arabinose transferase-like glycosyltransferase/Tfp pilus assembly protein PilF
MKKLKFHNSTIIIVLFFLSLALRFIYLLQINNTPLSEILLIDSESYDRFASLILKGNFKGEEVYSMNIFYPYFLALIYKIWGNSWTIVIFIQAIISSVNCVLIYIIARNMFDQRVGLLSAALCIFYGPFIFFAGTLLTPTLINLFLLLTLLFLVLYQINSKLWLVIVAGFCLGLAILGRGNSLLLVPLSFLFFYFTTINRRKAFTHWIIFGIAAIFFTIVVTIRNYYVEEEFVPLSANYGAFYAGHNEKANGLYTMPELAGSAKFESEVNGVRQAVGQKLGRQVNLAETSHYLFNQGLKYIIENPFKDLLLTLKKFYFFWNTTESPTNLNYYFVKDYSSLLRWLPLSFGIVAPLSILGIYFSLRFWRKHVLLYVYIFVYLFTCVVFFVSSEYRLPAVPVLIIFAAFAVFNVSDIWKEYRQTKIEISRQSSKNKKKKNRLKNKKSSKPVVPKEFLLIFVIFLPLFIFCNYKTPLLKLQSLKRVDYLNFGTLYRDRGEFGKARIMLKKSLQIDPRFGPAYEALAEVYRREGNDLETIRLLSLAQKYSLGGQYNRSKNLNYKIDDNSEKIIKASSLYQEKKYDLALKNFQELYDSFAKQGNQEMSLRTLNNVGLCYYKLANFKKAEEIFLNIIQEDSNYIKAYTNLARVYIALEKHEKAVNLYQRVLEIDPNNSKVQNLLKRYKMK